MNIFKKITLLLTVLTGILSLHAAHIGFLMPSGARQGTTVDIIVGGQAFWGISGAVVSGSGVEVESVKVIRSLPIPDGQQRRYIVNVLKNFHKGIKDEVKKPENTESWRKHEFYDRLTELNDCERDILYRFLFVPRNSLQASPAIAGRIIIRLKIAADAAPGERELRISSRNGTLSNPLKFFISETPEFKEEFFPFPPAVQKPVSFTIPGNLNGQITPGETDSFTFQAEKGEKLCFKLIGRYLKPFIGDGVPGHFQAVMEVVDKNKRTVAYADDYFFDPDPVLAFTVPDNGEYTLLIRDALYRGREDFVYRVLARKGEFPLPQLQVPDIPQVPVINQSEAEKAPVKFPALISGTLLNEKPDSYTISLKKNETAIVELFARRLGSPLDGVLKIFDKKGKMLVFNDDTERIKAGIILHNTADPQIIFTAPENGIYTLSIEDVSKAYGEAYKYFLRIDKKRAVFAVYTTPSFKLLSSGTSTPVKVIAERFGQYDGEIKLRVKSPAGIKITGADSIPAGTASAVITLEGNYDKNKPLLDLELEAYADNFKTPVIPGDESMQAFAYTHINPAQNFHVRVNSRTITAQWQEKKSVYTITPGKSIKLAVKKVPIWVNGEPEVTLTAENLPSWLKIVKNDPLKVERIKLKNKRIQAYLPPLEIVLQATADAPGKTVNQLFKIKWVMTSKPDKNGKTRIIKNQVTLPVIQIIGADK